MLKSFLNFMSGQQVCNLQFMVREFAVVNVS
jgi:hypothetical protein